MDNSKEYIVAAAYFLKEKNFPQEKRFILKHEKIRETYGELDDIYDIRIGRHHAEILHQFGKELDHHTDGFYTSYGRYVDRKTALKLAIECGQVDKDHIIGCFGGLDSSDVFR